jgi:hypothetical protein
LDQSTVAASIFNAAVADFASGVDVTLPSGIYFITVAEGVLALDQLFSRYLWELIDDSQTANWQNVGNTQSSSWTEINDTQNPNWERITP